MRRPSLPLFAALLLSGCLLGGGGKHFREGDTAYAQGNLEASERAYAQAVAKEPGNGEYKAALARVRKELSGKYVADARAKEQAGDWTGASAAWGEAAKLVPDDSSFAVRRDLSGQKAKNLGPDEWFAAVSLVSEQHREDEIGQRSLAGARAAAYQHNLQLGEEFLAASDGARAYQHFTRAKQIDPSTPGMRSDSFAQAEALSIAEQGDAKLDEGDPIRAYELYQEAYAKRPLPEIKRKLDRVRRQASALLSKLDRARKEAARGRYERALDIYESLMGMGGVPASMTEEVAKVRVELVKQDCAQAKRDIDRGNLRSAQRKLTVAVKHAQLDKLAAQRLDKGYVAAVQGKPEKTLEAIEAAGLEPGTPLEEASYALALASAKQLLTKAQRVAKRNGSQALKLVAGLDPFAEDLPGINELRRSLRAASFEDLLDEALTYARKGNDGESAALLLAALNASKAPPAMREPAAEAVEQLKGGKYPEAEEAFTRAQAAAPRSRLAQRGIDISRLRRKAAQTEAVATLKSGRGNQPRAVEILEGAERLEPGNAQTRQGASALVSRLERVGKEPDAEVGSMIGWATRLSSLPTTAREAMTSGAGALREGDLASAEASFTEALDAAPSEKLAQISKRLVAGRVVSSLKGDVAAVLSGDEAAAEALAELLKARPDDATGKKVLAQLIDKAKGLARDKKDAEAARYLKLATVATAPAPGVAAALNRGHDALAVGNMSEAEKAYDEARDLESGQVVAEAGYGITLGARQGELSKALAAATGGGSLDPIKAALKAAVAADAGSAQAKEAFEALIRAAEKSADSGNVVRAAQLLEAANVVSKPETARSAITAANGQLEKKSYDAAQAAYADVLKSGDSKVAAAGQSIAKEQQLGSLVSALEGLAKGNDLDNGAKAAAELRAKDPANKKVARAVDAAIDRAEAAGKKGDDKTAARELRAAAVALGEVEGLGAGLTALEAGKYPDAQAGFESSSSELGRRAAALARQRNLGTLASSLGSGGAESALSIKKLLAADPNNQQAQRAFQALLDDARRKAKAKKDEEAAAALKNASIAAAAPEDLSAAVDVGATHFAASRYPEAEQAFKGALELAKDSSVAKTGYEISMASRQLQEQEALRGLSSGDPRPHATTLKGSLVVDPNSAVVKKAFAGLLERAQRTATQGQDAETAQVLEAASSLEPGPSEAVAGIQEATALYAKASFVEAQNRFTAVNAGQEQSDDRSRVAELGAKLSLERRVALLEAELAKADKAKDVLRQSTIVAKIAKLDPNNREVTRRGSSLVTKVKAARLEAAETQKSQGKLGVAYLYLTRALELDPKESKAKSGIAEIEDLMKKRLDLIMVVERVRREKVSSTACKGFDGLLQEELQTVASKRTDLGGYVLSPAWTAAVKKGDERAPEISGAMVITMTRCSLGSATGKATFNWEILTPREGRLVAKGEVSAELPSGTIPRDEQDGAGKNARVAFSTRAAEAISEHVSTSRDETEQWLLTLAEHGMAKDDPALVADAWARIKSRTSKLIDVERLLKVEAYLDEKFR